jgi:hypothetical protein
MTGNNNRERQPLSRLVEALVEDILAASDEEILAEEAEAGTDPAKTAAAMQALFEKSVLLSNKDKMRRAKAGAEAARHVLVVPTATVVANPREHLRRVLASRPAGVPITLAARNESELSDEDVLGMLQDLEELGITLPQDKGEA